MLGPCLAPHLQRKPPGVSGSHGQSIAQRQSMDPTWAKRGALVAVGRTAPSSNGAGGSQPAGRAGDGVIHRDELESLPVVKLRWNAAREDLGDGLLCTDINISEISPAGGGVLGVSFKVYIHDALAPSATGPSVLAARRGNACLL